MNFLWITYDLHKNFMNLIYKAQNIYIRTL
jgi:hypothetical protein